MSRNLIALAAVCVASLALTACETPAPEGGVRIDNLNSEHPTLNTVRVIDSTLARYVGPSNKVKSALDVEGAFLSKGPTGLPKITVQIRNQVNQAIPLEVRVSWYNSAGVPVDSSAAWTHLFTQPQSMSTFEGSSIKFDATQYYVEIRASQ
jgi:uncharacterized protein YcfL